MKCYLGFKEQSSLVQPSRKKRAWKTCRNLLCSTAALISIDFASTQAGAVEGGIFGGPIGGTDIRSAYLPPTTGIYAALVGIGGNSPAFLDQNGNYSKTSNPAYFTAIGEGGGLLYVYPFKPLGFTVASSFQLVYAEEWQGLQAGPRHLSGRADGFLDSFGDLFFASRYLGLFGAKPGHNEKLRYGLTFAFGLGAEFPIGEYTFGAFPTTGKNAFIAIPSAAFTYLTGPNVALPGADGTEISTRIFFDAVARNPASGVQSGNIFDIDFAATERYGKFQGGVAGAYAQQTNSDITATGLQQTPNGNKFSRISVGPVLAYDSEELKTTFKLKGLFTATATNSYRQVNIVLSAAFKLY